MARRTMHPGLKFFLILVVVGGAFYGFTKFKDKILPEGKQATATKMDPATKAAAKDTSVVTMNIGVVTWPGYSGGQYYNDGFTPSVNSRYYKDYKILVNFRILDDQPQSREAWKKNEIDALWTTADAWPVEAKAYEEYLPKIFFQSDWSRGGDAIVVVNGINSVRDLRGKTIAVALATPSHSFLLKTLEAGNLKWTDLQIVIVPSAIEAAAAFKAGKVDAAVVWTPDDEDCLANVPGSKILINTKKAPYIIADVFVAKADVIEKKRQAFVSFVEGFLRGAGEINSNPEAKEKAIQILVSGLGITEATARKTLDRVRLTTYGDNLNFFGMNPNYQGVKGEDLYTQMTRLYSDPIVGTIKGMVPPWRNVVDLSILRAVKLENSGDQIAEESIKFAKATAQDISAPVLASKPISINFPTGSAMLDENAKTALRMSVISVIKQFASTRVRIEGNTDNVGGHANNVALSKRRAQSVSDFLSSECGCDANRFIVVGNGPDKPVADNETVDGRAANRRTDIQLLK
jgi:NitT/TauT family transport system substrate-binding protein